MWFLIRIIIIVQVFCTAVFINYNYLMFDHVKILYEFYMQFIGYHLKGVANHICPLRHQPISINTNRYPLQMYSKVTKYTQYSADGAWIRGEIMFIITF